MGLCSPFYTAPHSRPEDETRPPVSFCLICSEEIIRRQGQVDKQYAGLKELAEDRRKKLDHTYHHFLLNREVEDLEHWISERDVVASSQEMGQDLDHVTVTEPICFQNHSCDASEMDIFIFMCATIDGNEENVGFPLMLRTVS